MAFDDILLQIGEFGRYQRLIYVLLCLPVTICGFHMIGMSFFGLTVNTRCMLPNETAENTTYQMPTDIMHTMYIVKNKSGLVQACDIIPSSTMEGSSFILNDSRKKFPGNKRCEKFIYDTSVFESTTATEWDLVCDRAWLKTVGDSLFMVGVMLGSMFFGALSDKIGRRPSLFYALFIQLLGGLLVSIAPNYTLYVILRMIVGSACNGVLVVTFVMVMELIGPTKRGVAGVCFQLFWTTGYIIIAGVFYILPSWRKLQLAISLPSFVFIIYWWLVPESIRWMATNGKLEEAKNELQRASKKNRKEISRDTLDRSLEKNLETELSATVKASILDLFRYPNLRRKIIFLSINWFVIGGAYYGLSWSAVTLGGNVYINHLASGIVEIPATSFLALSFNHLGRKSILSFALFLVGAALVPTAFISEEYVVAHIALFMIGKTGISLCFTTIFVFTAEQIPTEVRNVGFGTCCTCGKIGGITAPFINILSNIWPPLPLITYGIMAFFCGGITTLLPETMGEKLQESIREGEVLPEVLPEISRISSAQLEMSARTTETQQNFEEITRL